MSDKKWIMYSFTAGLLFTISNIGISAISGAGMTSLLYFSLGTCLASGGYFAWVKVVMGREVDFKQGLQLVEEGGNNTYSVKYSNVLLFFGYSFIYFYN